MNNIERKYDWLKFRYKMHTLTSILDIPILILLYWLGYTTGFIIVLILGISSSLLIGNYVIKTLKELDLTKP